MENNNTSQLTAEQRAKLKEEKSKKLKRKKAQEEVRRKYFDYYDDVKTNIKQDW